MDEKKQYLTAQELLIDSFELGLRIFKSGFRPSFIIGVWRGGTPVGIAVQEILDHLGVKTDEHIGQTLASMHTASAKARQEMMDNIPVHEKVMQGVYSSYAEALQEIREKDSEIQKDFANRYGIDMKEIFEEFYASDASAPSGEPSETPESPEPPAEEDLLG